MNGGQYTSTWIRLLTDIFIAKFSDKKQTFHKSAGVVSSVVNSRLTSKRQQFCVQCVMLCHTRGVVMVVDASGNADA